MHTKLPVQPKMNVPYQISIPVIEKMLAVSRYFSQLPAANLK